MECDGVPALPPVAVNVSESSLCAEPPLSKVVRWGRLMGCSGPSIHTGLAHDKDHMYWLDE